MTEQESKDIIAQQFESASSLDELASLWADYLATMIRGDTSLNPAYIEARYKTLFRLRGIEGEKEKVLDQAGTAIVDFIKASKQALLDLGISQQQMEAWVVKHYPNSEVTLN